MTENKPKTAPKYACYNCDYICGKKSNYTQHLTTAKHKRMTNGYNNEQKTATSYVCECGKSYKYRQGLFNHKKTCNNATVVQPNNTNIIDHVENLDKNKDNEAMILALLTQNKELMNLLQTQSTTMQTQSTTMQEQSTTMQKQSDTIQEIIPKIGNNNTTNNTNNNKFNLQVFLNEDCKDAINFSEFLESIQVTVEDLENQAQVGYVDGISKLFLENLKELGVNRRPIHCTDKKRNTLYIKDNDEWDKEGSRDQLLYGIKVLNSRSHQRLRDMREENHEEYSDMDSDFSLKCMNIQRSLLPVFPRETSFGKVIASISNGSIVDREP